MTEATGIWILGNDISGVEKSIPWYTSEIPNFSDCNILIVDLTALDKRELHNREYEKCRELYEGIFARYKTGLKIYCILKESFDVTNLEDSRLENYFWSPIRFKIDKAKVAKKFTTSGNFGFQKYIDQIKNWDLVIREGSILPSSGWGSSSSDDKLGTHSVIQSQSNELLGGIFSHVGYGGLIHMFPPIKDRKLGIQLILDELGIENKTTETPPAWIENISIPGLSNLEQQIDSENSKIEEIQQGISKLKEKQEQMEEYRKLLFAESGDLEEIVSHSFNELGLSNVRKGRPGNYEDALFDLSTQKHNLGVVEVKSSKNNLKWEHVRQALHWALDYRETNTPKPILVTNIYRKDEFPNNRLQRESFKDSEEVCKQYDICIIPTTIIFDLICNKLEGKTINSKKLEELISSTSGTLIDVSSVIE